MLGALVLPGAKHGVARHHQLFTRILRKVALGVLLHDLLIFDDHFLQRFGVEIGVELGLLLFLLRVEHFVERRFLDVEHHIAEHLDQPAVRIGREPRIVAALGQRFHALVVQAKIENRVHHPRHGKLRARTHAHQQRILAGAELLALQRFQLRQRLVHLPIDVFGRQTAAHVLAASLGLNGESRRHRQAGIGHLGQARAFAAEHVFHLAVAIGLAAAERVDVFGRRTSCSFLRFSFGESHRRHDISPFVRKILESQSVVCRF